MSVESEYNKECPILVSKRGAALSFFYEANVGDTGSVFAYSVHSSFQPSNLMPHILPYTGSVYAVTVSSDPAGFGFGDFHANIYIDGALVSDVPVNEPFLCVSHLNLPFSFCSQLSVELLSNDMSPWIGPMVWVWTIET